jgi:hypothetical protein
VSGEETEKKKKERKKKEMVGTFTASIAHEAVSNRTHISKNACLIKYTANRFAAVADGLLQHHDIHKLLLRIGWQLGLGAYWEKKNKC